MSDFKPDNEPKPKPIILTDIEGTTSSVSFVKDIMFPYAADHLAAFVAAHGDDAAVQQHLVAVAQDIDEPAADSARLVDVLQQWIAEDRKATPLKALQGMIWKDGFHSGELVAHVYPDAITGLRAWKDQE